MEYCHNLGIVHRCAVHVCHFATAAVVPGCLLRATLQCHKHVLSALAACLCAVRVSLCTVGIHTLLCRDFKLENVMLYSKDLLKLTDFSARRLTRVGSSAYAGLPLRSDE